MRSIVLFRPIALAALLLLFVWSGLGLADTPIDVMLLQARVLYTRGDSDQAMDVVKQVLELEPQHVEARVLQGELFLGLDDPEAAEGALTQALGLDPGPGPGPGHEEALVLRALSRERLGRVEEAMADLSQALDMAPTSNQALFHRGRLLLESGDAGRALSDLSRCLLHDRSNALAWHLRGVANCNLKRFGDGLDDLAQVLELEPEYGPAWLARARCRIAPEVDDLAGAVADYRRAAELMPEAPALSLELSQALIREQSPQSLEEAEEHLDSLLQLAQDDPQAWLVRAEARLALGDNQGAAQDLRQVLILDPDHAEGYYLLGSLLTDQGLVQEAMENLERAAVLRPEYVPGLIRLGQLYTLADRYDRAVGAFTTALDLEPMLPAALYGRAFALLSAGEEAKALEDFTLAAELDPTPRAFCLMGMLRMGMGDAEGAARDFSMALELDHGYAYAYAARAEAYTQMGFIERALKDMERARELAPDLDLSAPPP